MPLQTSRTRTRSFGGCGTCRGRHVKCDEGKPTCSTCSLAGLVCAGYAKSIVFTADNDQSGTIQYRRQLFSDQERHLMSEALLAQVFPKNPHTLLAEIDTEWDGASNHYDEQLNIQRGPFGAFKVLSAPIDHVDSPDVSSFIANFLSNFDDLDLPGQSQARLTPALEPTWLNDSEENDIADFMGKQNETLTEQSVTLHISGRSRFTPFGSINIPTQLSGHRAAQFRPSPLLSPVMISHVSPTVEVMQDAPVLLKYYADVVIPLLTPFKHGKTPWHILFLPLAKTTLASITIGEIQDDASLAAFYGILSLSALHLFAASHNQRWSDQTNFFKDVAHQHITSAQTRAYDVPKVFKYKVVVIALLTMAQLSVAEGQRDQTEYWLLETEKFIRLRGLRKPHKSRKVRLLHHCYAYMRIFHESLLSPHMLSGRGPIVQHMIEDSGSLVPGQDNPSFRLTAWSNLNDKLREVKTRELGENDLHLASPGLWTSTLYPEIWGIPESWMTLLSQAIRLGNEKDLADTSDDAATISLREYSQRAKALERCILDWDASSHNTISAGISNRQRQISDIDSATFNNALRALHHALIIYFYRRTHDLDANTLQSQVMQVRDSLFACRQHVRSGSRYLAGLVWPAFVAACEATDADLQSSFLEWFELCSQHNGQYALIRMQEFVKSLWVKQREPNGASVTWLHLLRNKSAML